VTLRQLLQHTSGLPEFIGAPGWARGIGRTPLAEPTPEQLMGFVADEPVVFEPGSRYLYDNSDNIVAGMMVSAVTGQDFPAALKSLVLDPLGLRQTGLPLDNLIPRPYLHGYSLEPRKAPEDISQAIAMAWLGASGGMVSTPAELNRFARDYAAAKLFSRDIQAQQLQLVRGTSEPPGPGRNRAGLGIFRYDTRCGTVFGHTGNFPGYSAFLASTLDGSRSVAVSATEQLSESLEGLQLRAWRALRAVEEDAVCAALA
jgi:D-alanyl-D-alanine carboxypeptidase